MTPRDLAFPACMPERSAVAACIIDGLDDDEAARSCGMRRDSFSRHASAMQNTLGARSRLHLAAMLGAMAEREMGYS